MGNQYIRFGIGIVVAVVSLYFIWQYLYVDMCLDMGGVVYEGVCHDENYHEIYFVIDKPIPIIFTGAIFVVVCAVIVNVLIAKVTTPNQ